MQELKELAPYAIFLLICAVSMWRTHVRTKRETFIRNYQLPYGLFEKLRELHPHLDQKDCSLVASGLRQFFLAYHKSGNKYVSMPSQVADDLWHQFILNTRAYHSYCNSAFGKYFHHVPATALSANRNNNAGLRRIWSQTCKEEGINIEKPIRLPLLFALDKKLKIKSGFNYIPNCLGLKVVLDGGPAVHCGGDFSSPSSDGSTDGLNDGDGDGGDGDGCGGGCGGD